MNQPQTIKPGRNLLPLITHQREIVSQRRIIRQPGKHGQIHRQTRLHIHRATPK